MILQMKMHNLNTKLRLARDGPTSDNLQAIERETDELKNLLKQHTQATSLLATQIKVLSKQLQQNLKRSEEVGEAIDKGRKFCMDPPPPLPPKLGKKAPPPMPPRGAKSPLHIPLHDTSGAEGNRQGGYTFS